MNFYRTVIKIEVLSEAPYEFIDLENLIEDIADGPCSGSVSVETTETVDGPTMAQLLMAQGSDPGFFMLDESGNSIDDDEEVAVDPRYTTEGGDRDERLRTTD